MEINFNKVRNRINNAIIESAKSHKADPCIVCIYLLSLMFEIPFDLEQVKKYFDENPITNKYIQKYMKDKGVNAFYTENQNMARNVNYSNFDVLLKNGIVTTLSGNVRVPEGKFYTVQVLDFWGKMMYVPNGYSDTEKLMDKYICFYSKSENISKFVTFTDDKETVQA